MQPKYPKISVLIPVHNRLISCIEAIKSVLSQTYQSFEILLIDDGSQFDLYFWIEYYFPNELKIKKLRYLYQRNKGVSSARNVGIRESKSNWIALLDSDDIWKKEKLARQVQVLQQQHLRIIHTNEDWLFRGKELKQKKKHSKPSGQIFFDCLEFCRVSPSTVLIPREAFETCGLFDETLAVCEDYDLWLRLSLKYEFQLISESLVIKNGGHRDQLSYSEWGLDRFRIQSLITLLKTEILTRDQQEKAISMLREKLEYVINGAKKRGNIATTVEFEKIKKENQF